MTKVEELRDKLRLDGRGMPYSYFNEVLDSLISATRSEGKAEGVSEFEKKRADTFEKLIDDHDTAFAKGVAEGAEQAKPKIAESTEKLIDWILAMEPPYEGANPQWGRKVLLDLVATAAEQERERIRSESQMVGVDEDCIKFIGSADNYVGAAFLVPVDVMDPPVLAPTKEKP